MIENIFVTKIKLSNFLFKALLVFTVAQQIYFPQEMKYLHLALLFMTFLLLDIISEEYRDYEREKLFLLNIFVITVLSIIDYKSSFSLKTLYLMLLILASYQVINLVKMIIGIIKRKELHKISRQNINAIEKGPKFIIGLMNAISGTLIVSAMYCMYEIVKIII
jgi:hypothetical protein